MNKAERRAQMGAIGEELNDQLRGFQELAHELLPRFADMSARFAERTLEGQESLRGDIDRLTGLATQVTDKSSGFADTYARKLTDLSQSLVAKGPEYSELAGQMVAMAERIGVMAERIGEMGDRILFMADKIVAYGNRIVYVIQLTVYTEQMMVNFGTLLNHMITNMTRLQVATMHPHKGKDSSAPADDLAQVYENMNRMLDHMHAFSMKLLENEVETVQQQITFRDQQSALRTGASAPSGKPAAQSAAGDEPEPENLS